MNILFLTSGSRCPSTRYRVLQYLPYFQAAGHRYQVLHSFPEKYRDVRRITATGNHWVRRLFRYLDFLRTSYQKPDIIYLEREILNSPAYDIERLFLRLNIPFIVDVDDGVFLNYPQKYDHLLRHSQLVVAGSDDIADYCRKQTDRILVVPTSIELKKYQCLNPYSDKPPLIIGWTGTADNLSNFSLINTAIQDISLADPLELHIIAENINPLADIDFGQTKICYHPWSEASEIQDLQRFDIGLMPLKETPWNRYKCGFKILQYMGIGIPTIASPVGANKHIIQSGVNGFLAKTPEEWKVALLQLIESSALRRQLGQAGRRTVEQGYAVAKNYVQIETALKELCSG